MRSRTLRLRTAPGPSAVLRCSYRPERVQRLLERTTGDPLGTQVREGAEVADATATREAAPASERRAITFFDDALSGRPPQLEPTLPACAYASLSLSAAPEDTKSSGEAMRLTLAADATSHSRRWAGRRSARGTSCRGAVATAVYSRCAGDPGSSSTASLCALASM
jgi:hypothetical protein